MNNILRKTHPMVLIAAVALTIFSLLGSAAITGLIPSAYSQKQDAVQNITDSPTDAKSNDDMSRNSDQLKSKPAKTNSTRANGKTTSGPADVAACANCGTIVSIRAVESEGDATGLGAVAGGVAGGLVGNQIGKGKGNVLMTVLGIGGGAYAGHTIEKKMQSHTAYLIKVHMNDGSYRTVTQYSEPQHVVGDQVKLNSGQLVSA